MFFALWSPFFAHLYDSPPSHNFFATGFRPKKSAYQKIFDFLYTEKCTFLQKKKIDPVSQGLIQRKENGGFQCFEEKFSFNKGVTQGFFDFHEIFTFFIFDILWSVFLDFQEIFWRNNRPFLIINRGSFNRIFFKLKSKFIIFIDFFFKDFSNKI